MRSGLWGKKLERNQERDIEVNKYYYENGWLILRVWEHEFKQDFDSAVDKIALFIKEEKKEEKTTPNRGS